jgi:hypothetical protein
MAFDFGPLFDEASAAFRDSVPGEHSAAAWRDAEVTADKLSYVIQVPDELLMDAGVIPDTRVRRPPSLRSRLRWRVAAARERAGGLAYRLIAGHDVPEDA